MEASHGSEDIVVEVGGERSTGKDADNFDRNDSAICNLTKEEQLKTQTFASQSTESTILPGGHFFAPNIISQCTYGVG